VRLGNRRVAWFASGPLYATWAAGWYGELVDEGRIEAERLTTAWAGRAPTVDGLAAAGAPVVWSDPGAWDGGGGGGGGDS
jgi:hypothetical protein